MEPIQFTENVKEFINSINVEQQRQVEEKLSRAATEYCKARVSIFGKELKSLTVLLDSIYFNLDSRHFRFTLEMTFIPLDLPKTKEELAITIIMRVKEIFEFPDLESFMKDIEICQKQNEKHGK